MLNLITVSSCLFFIIITGWTLSTYFVQKNSQKLIREELKNLFAICKQFFVSLRNLIGVLANNSRHSESSEVNPFEESILDEDEQLLSLVQPAQGIEAPSLEVTHEEDDDTALSSFSPEVIAVIKDEEEKAA